MTSLQRDAFIALVDAHAATSRFAFNAERQRAARIDSPDGTIFEKLDTAEKAVARSTQELRDALHDLYSRQNTCGRCRERFPIGELCPVCRR